MIKKIYNSNWDIEIRSNKGWFDIDLAEIWRYRDLILLFVHRDFVSSYKQTLLGPFWFFVQPLFTTIVFAVIFGNIAKIPTDGIPPLLFYMSGIIIWTFFASNINTTSNTLINNAGIFNKVYFPRLVVPISVVITNLLTFLFQFFLFVLLCLFYHFTGYSIYLTVWIFFLPLLLFQISALGLGFGILISSLTTKYRDLAKALGFGVQLWMYATPILYPLSQVSDKWQWIFSLNPMTVIIEIFRYAFFGCGVIQLWMVVQSLGITILVLIIGILLFNRIEKSFVDIV